MWIVAIAVLGLGLGSFVNALVWRVYMQEDAAKTKAKIKSGAKKPSAKDLSIATGRSMCPHCQHTLAAADLVPVVSWLLLRGKCRYCGQPISPQYPLVELAVAVLFVVTYLYWPYDFDTAGLVRFATWLVMIAGFVALAVYDLRWMKLPNRILYPLIAVAAAHVVVQAVLLGGGAAAVRDAVLGVAFGGGLFYGIFQLSGGRWIGGGDVKLGFLIGLLVGGPAASLLVLFAASVLGTLFILPLMFIGRLKRQSRVPFGPFLMAGAYLVLFIGRDVIAWYKLLIGL